MTILFLCLASGAVLGWKKWLPHVALSMTGKAMTAGVIFLLVTMGIRIGVDREVLTKLGGYGVQAFLFAVFTILLSIAFVWFLEKLFVRSRENYKSKALGVQEENHPYRMTAIILGAFFSGIIIGIFLFPQNQQKILLTLTTLALNFTIFTVGLDLGLNREVWKQILNIGWQVLLAPLGVAVGSIAAGMLVGKLLGWTWLEGGAVGAGFGWYSLSGVLISQIHSVSLGTIAFLSNVLRELIAILLIPFLARRVGALMLVAPGGASTMDTTLPLIAAAGPPGAAVVAFINGVSLTALVPLLVPLLLGK